MRSVGIVQPGKVGDIVIALPIAKWYADRGFRVVWPVERKYLPLLERAPYVTPVDMGWRYDPAWQWRGSQFDVFRMRRKCIRHLESLGMDRVLDLSIGYGLDEREWQASGMPFDEWKYSVSGVPFRERFKLMILRDRHKENTLKDMRWRRGKYVVTHSRGSRLSRDFGIPNAVEVRPIKGFTLFDWIGVIEGAAHVHCVDSCVANLVNQLGLAKGRRTFYPWDDYSDRPLTKPSIDWREG